MFPRIKSTIGIASIGLLLAATSRPAAGAGKEHLPGPANADSKVDYNRDIRPILSENCYACHGPDEKKRKAGLRLDRSEEPYKQLESGKTAIVPGDLAKSELIRRITTTDEDDHMPPPKSGKRLSAAQIELFRRWVRQGAQWKGHWAYLKPERSPLPPIRNKQWPRNAIDHFILSRLEKEGLKPSREADKIKLIRRVTLDLTGLPPTIEDVDLFLADKSPEAYERLVDRLLSSPAYGERMAQFWLDLARYADTNGYHIDNNRDIWKWREWVIDAFNRNLPFDEFTIEQLAGDLLPSPTLQQRIATGFNRNEMVNFEGGADPNEYATKYIVGRVDTTAKVFLGSTLACAECHDHKFDPFSQKEYYRFYAFFNTIAEKGLDGNTESPAPRLKLPSPEEKANLNDFAQKIASLETQLKQERDAPHAARDAAQAEWEQRLRTNVVSSWTIADAASFSSAAGTTLTKLEDNSILASGTTADKDTYEIVLKTAQTDLTGLRLEALPHETLPAQRAGRSEKGDFVLTGLEVEAKSLQGSKEPPVLELPALGPWHALGPFQAKTAKKAFTDEFGPEKEKEVDLTKTYDEGKLKWTPQPDWKDGEAHELKGENCATYLYRTITVSEPRQLMASLGSDDGIQVWLNGRKLLANDVARGVAPDQDKVRLQLAAGENKLLLKINNGEGGYAFYFNPLKELVNEYPVVFSVAAADFNQKDFNVKAVLTGKTDSGWSAAGDDGQKARDHQAFFVAQQPFGFAEGTEIKVKLKFESYRKQTALGRFRLALTASEGLTEFAGLPDNIRSDLIASPDERRDQQKTELQKYYRENFVDAVKDLNTQIAAQKETRDKLDQAILTTMVMQEMEKPRDTFVLVRGDFRNQGEKVTPGVPKALSALPDGLPANRLGLARWLVDPNHPLTSRVTVNRFWQQYFGAGLVKTSNDFGSQGDWPSDPELLDWLATEFIALKWDIKAMQKLIVMSATYRQDSVATAKLLERDPYNRLLTRGPRFRLDAEVIRDEALAVSGLLNRQMGGASVRPYQPPGLWEAIGFFDNGNFTSQKYVQSTGPDLYRRGLYTYWKRSLPYPSFFTFDAPNREVCTVQRPRTSTPLQALVLMNDPTYVEAARALAQRVIANGGDKIDERLSYAFRLTLARRPLKKELQVLERVYRQQLETFRQDKKAAEALTHVGESPCPANLDVSEWAAWTAISNILLNLDEAITKG